MTIWQPHSEFQRRRYPDDPRCGGSLVFIEQSGAMWMVECDGCGYFAAVPANQVDPNVGRKDRLEATGIPAIYQGLQFDEDDENKSTLYAVRAWLSEFNRDPLPAPAIWGKQGRGKSHLLAATCSILVKRHDAQVMFTSVRALLRDLQRFDNETVSGAAWKRATGVQVLALDDLGAERITDWRHEQVAELVDERYAGERPILLATNLAPSMWDQAVDARTASRLAGMCMPVELKGSDRRQTTIGMETG